MHELESKLFQLAQRLAEENKELSEELLILATMSHSYQEPNINFQTALNAKVEARENDKNSALYSID